MIDTSDGLVRDASRVARASEAQISLAVDSPGLSGTMEQLARLAQGLGEEGDDAVRWLLGGGEDHALLAAWRPAAELPAGFAVVGRVGQGQPESPVTVEGGPANHEKLATSVVAGFDHFS
jgi:thiamine-monophosphate kinase